MTKLRFDLQLFAANVQTTELNNNTTPPLNDLSPEMKKFYNTTLIKKAQPMLVHAQFGEKVGIPKNGGKTIEFREFTPFQKALTPLTEGVTPDGVLLNVTKIEKTLAEYGAYTTVSDLLELTAVDNIIVETTELHANAMGLTLDTIVRNELNSQGTVIYADAVGQSAAPEGRDDLTAAHKLTREVVAKAVAILKKRNAPKIDGSYIGIIHPSVEYDLITSQGWIDVQQYSNATQIFEGEIGKLYGVRFVVTSEAQVFKGTGSAWDQGCAANTAVYSCLFLGKGAYKVIDVGGAGARIIVKPRGSGGPADPLDQRSTIGWKIPMFGAKVVIPDYIVRVECGSSFSAVDAA